MSSPRKTQAESLADETTLRKLAAAGDTNAFTELTGSYRAGLHAHCYRMLGSVHDADDALQEALLRAWRSLPGFQGRGSLRSWLYSIATNTALDIAKQRSRREFPVDFNPAASCGTALDPPQTDLPWLEPYPDRWLPEDQRHSPEARYEQRESLELAFIVAIQHLAPLQRAVLLLREVLGFSTEEIASQLDTSPAAVNSALQRARDAVQHRLPTRTQQSSLRLLGDQRTKAIVQRYADATERGDVATLISMLTEDATWSMPPHPTWFRGHAAIRDFLIRYPLTQRWKHIPTSANGQLALGCYLLDPAAGGCYPAVIDVLTMDGEKIAGVTGFLTAETIRARPDSWETGTELFARFGLPATAPA